VHALFLGVLAISAIRGLIVVRNRLAREPAPAPPSGGPTAVSPERESDVRAITDLLASFVEAYKAKDEFRRSPGNHQERVAGKSV
jgi:hypothetical protein